MGGVSEVRDEIMEPEYVMPTMRPVKEPKKITIRHGVEDGNVCQPVQKILNSICNLQFEIFN